MKSPALLKFAPRFFPRNGMDAGLLVLVTALLVPVIVLLLSVMTWTLTMLASLFIGDRVSATLPFLCQQLVYMAVLAYCAILPILRLEFTEEGIRMVRFLQTVTIPWEDIETVEELSPLETTRIVFQKDFFTGKLACPGTLTLADYVLIHHKNGAILFPPQNKEIFLHELRKHRERNQVQLEEPVKTTPWYWTASGLREENQQTISSRRQG